MIRHIQKRSRVWKLKTHRLVNSALGTIRGNTISAYWSFFPNFGDLITPLLLKHYGLTPVHSFSPENAEIVSTGSILQWMPEDFAGIILGTGLIQDETRQFPHARIAAVRGQLTAERINAPADVVLGDPGLLAPAILKKRPPKTHVLGLIPHYIDRQHAVVRHLSECHTRHMKCIDVRRPPELVFRDIAACEHILSSSLHGLIVADSFGIPNAWLHLSDDVLGQGFKFYDYFSSLSVKRQPHVIHGTESLADLTKLTRRPPECVNERREQLHRLFSALSKRAQ